MPDDTAPFALLVDDNPIIILDASDILDEAGFRPLQAGNVDGAIKLLERWGDDIRLLFTDVQMPGERDGFDLARETAFRWPDIKILVASGDIAPEVSSMPDNAVFITKPFSAEVVHARLRELLAESEKPEPPKQKAVSG